MPEITSAYCHNPYPIDYNNHNLQLRNNELLNAELSGLNKQRKTNKQRETKADLHGAASHPQGQSCHGFLRASPWRILKTRRLYAALRVG